MRVSPFTAAEETLGASSAMQGLSGMERTAAPKGPNMFDGGPTSKVAANPQGFNNDRHIGQSMQQNITAKVPQEQAQAIQDTRKMSVLESNREYKAQADLQQRLQEIQYVMGAPATAAMGSMNDIETAKFRQDIATGKAMAMGMNPDLISNQVSEQRYA